MNELETESESPGIIKFEGLPSQAGAPDEQTRWQRFLNVLWPFTRQGGKLAKYGTKLSQAYIEAEIANKENQAKKTGAEAAEIAARTELVKNDSCRLFNEQIDAIFSDSSLPEAAKLLKLAKLMESNPEVVSQIERVSDIMERLALTRGASIEIRPVLDSVEDPKNEAIT